MGEHTALLPCPFCGARFLMGQEPHDNAPVNGMFYLFHDYGTLGSPARKCPIDVRRHFDTEAEAVAAWNVRAKINTHPAVTVVVEALEFIRDGYANQDVNHIDYRVKVYQVALDALSRFRELEKGNG